MKSLQTRFHLIGLLAIVVVAAAISLPGLARASARSASAAPAHATVVIRDIAFRASSVTIARGGTVTWQWRDGDPALGSAVSHTVTSLGSKRFRSAGARNHGAYSARFRSAGTYRYECTIHVGMTGRVVVR